MRAANDGSVARYVSAAPYRLEQPPDATSAEAGAESLVDDNPVSVSAGFTPPASPPQESSQFDAVGTSAELASAGSSRGASDGEQTAGVPLHYLLYSMVAAPALATAPLTTPVIAPEPPVS